MKLIKTIIYEDIKICEKTRKHYKIERHYKCDCSCKNKCDKPIIKYDYIINVWFNYFPYIC